MPIATKVVMTMENRIQRKNRGNLFRMASRYLYRSHTAPNRNGNPSAIHISSGSIVGTGLLPVIGPRCSDTERYIHHGPMIKVATNNADAMSTHVLNGVLRSVVDTRCVMFLAPESIGADCAAR
jgi:hypothetical protein